MPENSRDNDKTETFVAIANGTVIAQYKIIEKIGAGGMGEVYLAEDTQLNREVALKFLPAHLCRDADCRARFKREAQAVAKLNHPNIVTIYEVGEYQNRPFIAMEHIVGQPLRDVIKSNELLIDKVVELAIQICKGLQEAHEAGIVHRDIKPGNIVIDNKNRLRLLDFGLAAIQGGEDITKAGSTLGTLGYMSPEQVHGKGINRQSDLFSFGIVLYEMIAGQLPFKGDTEAATMNSILNDAPHPLSRYKSDVSGKLQDIVSKLLEKDPQLRYQSAAGIISDLKRLVGEQLSDSGKKVPPPSIAVLPFTNLSADPEQEYFCDGMAEEIINALTRIEGLRVVARTSCFAFKGKNEDIREIGRKLNVNNVLEGSVRKAGNRIRITGQLIKISDGYHLWSDKFDRDLEDIFEIQDEISLVIAQKLKGKLLGDSQIRPAKRPTNNLEAYNLYLRGRHFWNKRTDPGLKKSIEFFDRAVKCDPEFALGHAGLADAYGILADYDRSMRKKHLAQAEEFAFKALELDGTLAEAHSTLAFVRFNQWKWAEAELGFIKAVKLNPGYATAHHWYSLFLAAKGRFEQAWEHIKLARELDPLSLAIIAAQAFGCYITGQHDKTIEICQEGLELNADFPLYSLITGWSLVEKGNYDEAIKQFYLSIELAEKELLAENDSRHDILYVGRTYALMGEFGKAQEILEDTIEKTKNEHVPLFPMAALCFVIDDMDRGFEWLEHSVEEQEFWLPVFRFSPLFDSVRNDPRFMSLMSRIGIDDKLPEVSDE